MSNDKEEHTLTQTDAQDAIWNTPFRKELEDQIPPSVRVAKWKSLIDAQEIKVFNGERGIVYSRPMDALNVQLMAMEKVSRLAGDFPSAALTFGTGDGKKVTLEMHFGGEEDEAT